MLPTVHILSPGMKRNCKSKYIFGLHFFYLQTLAYTVIHGMLDCWPGVRTLRLKVRWFLKRACTLARMHRFEKRSDSKWQTNRINTNAMSGEIVQIIWRFERARKELQGQQFASEKVVFDSHNRRAIGILIEFTFNSGTDSI